MKKLLTVAAFLIGATPVLAEKGDIYNCSFKVKRGQWLTEQVVFGIGHSSGKSSVYDGMIHLAHGKPMPAEVARDDDSRLILLWTVFVDDSNGKSRKVNMKLSYIKKNARATYTSDVAGFENHDTARGNCKKSVGNV